jgi:hypothetical protein
MSTKMSNGTTAGGPMTVAYSTIHNGQPPKAHSIEINGMLTNIAIK